MPTRSNRWSHQFRASRGVERRQLRWVAAGAVGAVALLLLAGVGAFRLLPEITAHAVFPAMLWPPLAIAVARPGDHGFTADRARRVCGLQAGARRW